MEREEYQQAKDIFHAVLDLSPGERKAYLDSKCSGRPEIRKAVERLLDSCESDFLESPAVNDTFEKRFIADRVQQGQVLGHYRIREKIGTGGMGEVFLADDIVLGRPIALKLLSPSFTSDADRTLRFHQEVRTASALNHPNILTIHEIGVTDDLHFMATEFIEGVTLREKLKGGALSYTESLDIALQVAAALDAVHRAGIVHRDIKPENIMVRDDGLVKVLDFGLAKLLRPEYAGFLGNKLRTTSPGIVMGTVAYMSPEQARGEMVDERTDIWSLGVVLYEMLAGRVPFEGDTRSDAIAAILRSEIELPITDWPAVDSLIDKSMQKKREDRWPTVRDLLTELRSQIRKLEAEVPDTLVEQIRTTGDEQKLAVRTGTDRVQITDVGGESTADSAPDVRNNLPSAVSFARGDGLADTSQADDVHRGSDVKTYTATGYRHAGTKSGPNVPVGVNTAATAASVSTFVNRGRSFISALIVLFVAAASFALYFLNSASPPPLTDKDVVLLSDFENKTGDEVFDGTLAQGLEIQLQQSPYLSLFSGEQVRETLKLMQRPPDEKITPNIAREICQRRGLKAFITGTLAPVGSNYALTLKAVNAQTDELIASEIEEAEGKEKILAALSRAATGLREKLGESLQSIERFDSPIELTTTSLEALKLHAMGSDAMRSRYDYPQAISLFKRAIEIDPNFAYAYIELAVAYENSGQGEYADENIIKAYKLRDRVSERERLLITDSYYSTTGDVEKRREVLLVLKQLYPRDLRMFLRLSRVHEFLGDYEKAIEVAREGLRESNRTGRHLEIIRSYLALNRFDEAKAAADNAIEVGYDRPDVHRLRAEIAVATGDQALLGQAIERIPDPRERYQLEAWISMRSGRYENAKEQLKKAIEIAKDNNARFRAGFYHAQLAGAAGLIGKCRDVEREVAKAFSMDDGMLVSASAEIGLAFCGKRSLAESLITKRIESHPDATVHNKVTAPIVRAALKINEGEAAPALEILGSLPEALSAARCAYQAPFLRGTAYLKLRRGPEAAKEFKRIIDSTGEGVFSPLYPLAYLGLARAQGLTGDLEGARQNYQKFFEIWKDADADLPPLVEAKREYAKLQKKYGWES